MKKIVITLGTISGLILVIMLALSLFFMQNDTGDQVMRYGEIVGYATMIIALSLIYVGIRRYRDGQQAGVITFGKGFQIGITITLIASVIYVVGWMILSDWLAPDFIERYAEMTLKALQEKGASAEEIAEAKATNEQYLVMYQNPLLKAGMTFMEVFPVGLIVTLISAFILKRN